jgi:Peptidase family S41
VNGLEACQVLYQQVREPLREAVTKWPIAGDRGDDRGFSAADRENIVDHFLLLIEGAYVHLPQKRATYGHDPVQRLRLLRQRIENIDNQTFHNEMVKIATDLRDAHTRYVGPQRLDGYVAVLPFLLEAFGSTDRTRFIASKVVPFDTEQQALFKQTGFRDGVEVTYWNGTPIRRAVDLHADLETGGRADARLARAVESMTIRSMRYGQVPDEHWVTVTFKSVNDAAEHDVRIDWRLAHLGKLGTEPQSAGLHGLGPRLYGGNPAAEATRRARTLLFATDVWDRIERGVTQSVAGRAPATPEGDWIAGRFETNVAARRVTTDAGVFGHLRLWSFDVSDDGAFIDEVIELLLHLPRNGLIIDLRGNPGGLIWAAERLLQLFTPNSITPTIFSMVATPLGRLLADAPQNRRELSPWRGSLFDAVRSGEVYTRGAPLTPPHRCNDIGQQYPGPVVAIVDATTYSAGDLFAAGFVDNRLGTLVSIGKGTAGGGANVWFSDQLVEALQGIRPALPALPIGVGFSVAFRRATRVGSVAGLGIEDVGVLGHIDRSLSYDDLVKHNVDLMNFCGKLLASESHTDLWAKPTKLGISLETLGLDRVDVYVDERPHSSMDVKADKPQNVKIKQGWSQIDVVGFSSQLVRQRRRVFSHWYRE